VDSFLPEGEIYIRDSMRNIFGLFEERDIGKTVLIGSAGVGKSVLFFLAALRKATKKPVLFYRKTDVESYTSVFLMQASQHGVDIVFSRKISSWRMEYSIGGLNMLNFRIKDYLSIRTNDALVFVDGPQYDDERNGMRHYFNFFCTSGHPL
jgi:hypothetical protein